jgi:hypothetical protein
MRGFADDRLLLAKHKVLKDSTDKATSAAKQLAFRGAVCRQEHPRAPYELAKDTIDAPGFQALLALAVLGGLGALVLLTVLFQPEGRCTVVPALQIDSRGPRC